MKSSANNPGDSPFREPLSPADTDPLDALLDLVPRLEEKPEFVDHVLASIPKKPHPDQVSPHPGWLQRWTTAFIEAWAIPRGFLPSGQTALATLAFGLLILGSWWILTPSSESPEAFTRMESPITETLSLDELEDRQVVEDLDWIMADLHNELWTSDDLLVVF